MTTMLSSLNDFWSTHTDRFSQTLPLLGNPVAFFATTFVITLATSKIASMHAKRFEKYDLRPAMMIANGLIFGFFGIGFFLGMAATNLGMDSFDCDAYAGPDSEDFKQTSVKLIAWLYMALKFGEFQRPLFASLRGTSNSDHYKSWSYYYYLFGQLIVTYIGACFHPGGLFALWCLLDAMVTVAEYSYLILKLASRELHPNPRLKKIIKAMRFMTFVALACHGFYFSSIPNCIAFVIIQIEAWYNVTLIVSVLYFYLFRSAKSKPAMKSSNSLKHTFTLDSNGNDIKRK